VQGKRIAIEPDENGCFAPLAPGEYGQHPQGFWYASVPNGYSANLAGHQVVEHDDGTITVSPSILVRNGQYDELWHGYLERGVWREC
jgi:hypothetical protein